MALLPRCSSKALLKSFFCPNENTVIELWGDRNIAPDRSVSISVHEVHFKKRGRSVEFAGYRFHAKDALDGIQEGLEEMKKDTSCNDFVVWGDDEQEYGVQLVRGRYEGYMFVYVDDVNRKWNSAENKGCTVINIKNLDNIKKPIDDIRDYIKHDGYDSEEENSSEEEGEEVSTESESEDPVRRNHLLQLGCDPVPFPHGSSEYDEKNKIICWMADYRRRCVIFLQQKPKRGESKRDRLVFMPVVSFQKNLTKKLASFLADGKWGEENEITVRMDNCKTYYEVRLERNKENEDRLELIAVCTNFRDDDKNIISRIDIKYVREFMDTLCHIIWKI